jgi:hypothetical protein
VPGSSRVVCRSEGVGVSPVCSDFVTRQTGNDKTCFREVPIEDFQPGNPRDIPSAALAYAFDAGFFFPNRLRRPSHAWSIVRDPNLSLGIQNDDPAMAI